MASQIDEKLQEVEKAINSSLSNSAKKRQQFRVFRNDKEDFVIVHWFGDGNCWRRIYGNRHNRPHNLKRPQYDAKIYYKGSNDVPKSWELTPASWAKVPLTGFVMLFRSSSTNGPGWVLIPEMAALESAKNCATKFGAVAGVSGGIGPWLGGGSTSNGPNIGGGRKLVALLILFFVTAVVLLAWFLAESSCIASDNPVCQVYENIRYSLMDR